MPVYPLNTLDFSISASAFHARRGSRGAIPLKIIVLPPANQIRRADGQKPFEKMDVANGPRLNRNVSSDHGLEESEGGTRGISQASPRSPGGLFKIQQRKQQLIAMLAPRRTQSAAAVESCSTTAPRLNTEFGSPSSSNGSMASQSERPRHGSPGGLTKARQRKQKNTALALSMNLERSRASIGSRSSTLPLLSLQLLDKSDEMDDSGESTSICESSKREASSSSSTSDGSSDEAGGDDDPPGEGDDDDEREGEGGYDDDEEEVSGDNSEDQAGGEDIEDVSFICLLQILYLPPPTPVPTPPFYHRINVNGNFFPVRARMRRKRKKKKTILIETSLSQRRKMHIQALGAELEQSLALQIIHLRMKTWKAAAAAAA